MEYMGQGWVMSVLAIGVHVIIYITSGAITQINPTIIEPITMAGNVVQTLGTQMVINMPLNEPMQAIGNWTPWGIIEIILAPLPYES